MVVYPGKYQWYQLLHSFVTIQLLSACRYMEHHFLATTEGSSLGSFPEWFLKIWHTDVQRQNSFDSVEEVQSFLSFSTTVRILLELERNGL